MLYYGSKINLNADNEGTKFLLEHKCISGELGKPRCGKPTVSGRQLCEEHQSIHDNFIPKNKKSFHRCCWCGLHKKDWSLEEYVNHEKNCTSQNK